jgi:D-alanine-D-alanine ligase
MYGLDEIKQMKTAVLCGGWSLEREVSLRSGKNVYNALKNMGCNAILIDVDKDIVDVLKKEKPDAAFNALHGIFGEDGGVQAILDMLEIPYSGSGVLASAIGMDKLMSKRVAISVGIKTSDFLEIKDFENDREKAIGEIGFPMVVKPVKEGSSLGVSIVKNTNELYKAVEELKKSHGSLFCEKYIKGREVTVGVISGYNEIKALPILELCPKKDFYDFEAKYTKGLTEFILPAKISDNMRDDIQGEALKMHQTLGCKGASRSDFIIDENNVVYFLEINTSPGMTDTSDVPAEAASEGINMEELVLKILQSAF